MNRRPPEPAVVLGTTFNRARSVLVSLPMTFSTLSLDPSLKLTMISSAPSMTWLFVTMRPSLPSTTKPEPCAVTFRSDGERLPLRLKKSSKNSSNGAPFGTFGSGAPSAPFRFWLVEMLTTASMSFSAIGATLAGPPFVCVAAGADRSTSALEASTAASAAARDRAWRAADFTATRIVSGVCGCAGPLMAYLLPLH